ncbi:unnamed protein product [Albugo candida]|uniref:Uncharacterized protein n=1 Tax=Albugo candida TaxID=65357 RepID=A0A024GT72_9STRA|nr:unnamed protein product [Albugo candida]|eukprot:CCI49782.1 unnamed protein product [Albugo candida]
MSRLVHLFQRKMFLGTNNSQSESTESEAVQSDVTMTVEPTHSTPTEIPSIPMDMDDAATSLPVLSVNKPVHKETRPLLADILKGHEEIHKGKAVKKATWKVEMPKLLAADLSAIKKHFGRRSSKLGLLETGQALVRTPPAHILQSFVRDHGNVIVDELFETRKIGELAKLPGGNLRLLVTDEEVCKTLAHETVTILGNKYLFHIFGIGKEMSTLTFASTLHRLGCDVLYENFAKQRLPKDLQCRLGEFISTAKLS